MDQQSFDRLARVLGEATDRREGLKRALAAVLGGSSAVAALEERAEASRRDRDRDRSARPGADRKKRKTCRPSCVAGYVCEKIGRKRQCVCASGVTCGATCCAASQRCEGGDCVDAPDPGACLAFGEACKNAGKRCCDGLSCASGQDGSYPVACYRAKSAACERTAECPFGMACTDGRCRGSGGGGTSCVEEGGDCSAGTCCDGLTCGEGDVCARAAQCIPDGGTGCGGSGTCCPGSACDGDTCSSRCAGTGLALDAQCCSDSQCASGLCWYPQDSSGYPLDGPAGLQKVCSLATGSTCGSTEDCALANYCDSVCTDYDSDPSYVLMVPTGGTGCDADHPCFYGYEAWCDAGTCVPRTPKILLEPCNPATDQCTTPDTTCTHYPVGSGAADTTTTYCLGTDTYQSPAGPGTCASYRVWNDRCTRVCSVYLTSGTADTDVARGVALKQALADFNWNPSDMPAAYFLIEPDTAPVEANRKRYTTSEITLNFAAGKDAYIMNCFQGGNLPNYIVSGGWSGGSATDGNRILNVTSARKFQIQFGTFENGRATAVGSDDGNGGAIRWDMSAYTWGGQYDSSGFNFATVRNSTAAGNGGGVYSIGTLVVSGASTISGNTAGGQGGGWYAKTLAGKPAKVANEWSITLNTATTGDGAGFVLDGPANTLVCTPDPQPGPGITANVGTTSGKYDCAYEATAPSWTGCGCTQAES